ncbi:hypothetical protein EJ08DRAFT_173239 [Tothia fuscella]|uniref:Uncharacterized protein n=1 Tax=Tothia fuscella TaxID=1048955 RepID=A0A9P4NUV0_9PEZI|nr:hypothetical protein EJ08DRAFT_173239 [Tothia fuscella]
MAYQHLTKITRTTMATSASRIARNNFKQHAPFSSVSVQPINPTEKTDATGKPVKPTPVGIPNTDDTGKPVKPMPTTTPKTATTDKPTPSNDAPIISFKLSFDPDCFYETNMFLGYIMPIDIMRGDRAYYGLPESKAKVLWQKILHGVQDDEPITGKTSQLQKSLYSASKGTLSNANPKPAHISDRLDRFICKSELVRTMFYGVKNPIKKPSILGRLKGAFASRNEDKDKQAKTGDRSAGVLGK